MAALVDSVAHAKRLVTKPTSPDGLVLEAWAQGYMVGSLIILSAITISNMRKGVLLHKLILIEVNYLLPRSFENDIFFCMRETCV